MKTLLTALVIGSAVLLPATTVHAAPVGKTTEFAKASGPIGPKKFSLKVKKKTFVERVGFGPNKIIKKAPPGMPGYAKNAAFSIAKNGDLVLTGKKITIDYVSVTGNIVKFSGFEMKGTTTFTYSADIEVNAKKKPVAGILNVVRNVYKGTSTTTHTVTYEF
jgi:hypothetical protein